MLYNVNMERNGIFNVEVLGDNVFYVRKLLMQKTQEEFAELLDVTPETVSNIERGRVLPNTKTLVNLANISGRSIDFFFVKHPEAFELASEG